MLHYPLIHEYIFLLKHLNSQHSQLLLLKEGAWVYFPLLHDNIVNKYGQSRERENEKKSLIAICYYWLNQSRFLISTQTISLLCWSQSGLNMKLIVAALHSRITLPFAVVSNLLWLMGGHSVGHFPIGRDVVIGKLFSFKRCLNKIRLTILLSKGVLLLSRTAIEEDRICII